MTGLPIGVVAREAGVAPSAIRYYETIGLVTAPARRGGKRCYDVTVLDELAFITTARSAGFTIVEIRALRQGVSGGKRSAWAEIVERKRGEMQQLIVRAERMKNLLDLALQCGCVDARLCQLAKSADGQDDLRHPLAG